MRRQSKRAQKEEVRKSKSRLKNETSIEKGAKRRRIHPNQAKKGTTTESNHHSKPRSQKTVFRYENEMKKRTQHGEDL
jgi:hypothetical protein